MPLRKIISGGQTGADEAGLYVARRFGLETGGTMPKGFKTLTGPRPDFRELYGIEEHGSDNYVPRTYKNVADSDGTVRLAGNFGSRGEICTLKAIEKYDKPYFDVDLTDLRPVDDFVAWLSAANIKTLNVAGNAEQTFKGSFAWSVRYLTEAMFIMGLEMTVTDEELLVALGLDPKKTIVYADDRRLVEHLLLRKVGVRARKREEYEANVQEV